MVDAVTDVEPCDVIHRLHTFIRTGAHPPCTGEIADHLGRIEHDAPGIEQLLQIGTGVGRRHAGRRGGGCHGLAPRVDHRHQPPAAHDELVDGVESCIRQVLRLGHQQHLDVGIDHLCVGGDRLHLVGLPQQGRRCIGLTGATALAAHRHHHRAWITVDRQRRHHADHGTLRVGQVVDQFGQVVFKEALALRLEEGDGAFIVFQVAAGQAEIHLHAALIHRYALQAISHRAVLGVAERLGIVELEPDLAAGQRGVFSQHLAHVVGEGAVERYRAAQPARIEQAQRDRLLQAGQDLQRAGRQRVDLVARQVDTQVGQPRIGEHVDADDDGGDRDDADDGGPDAPAHCLSPPCVVRR